MRQVSQAVVDVPQGSLYPALHRLEYKGFLKADWTATEGGRESKLYSLTRTGKAQLQKETESWNRLAEAVQVILALDKASS